MLSRLAATATFVMWEWSWQLHCAGLDLHRSGTKVAWWVKAHWAKWNWQSSDEKIIKNLYNSNGRNFVLESSLNFYHGSDFFSDHLDWFYHLSLSVLDSSRVSAFKIYQHVWVETAYLRQAKVVKRAKTAPGPPAQWPSMRPMPPTSFTGYWEMKDSDNSRTLPVDLFCHVLQLATCENDRESMLLAMFSGHKQFPV